MNLMVAPPDTRLVIPRINRNVPVVNVSTEALIKKDWAQLERDMQEALRFGVIHYPGTARPGQQGNIVITGHSSYFPWDPGRFKDVFAVLHDARIGDQILLYNNQKRYIYEVTGIKKVWPSELVSRLKTNSHSSPVLQLNKLKRLVVN
jgi:LPXTG-site transpeptidase (sortase) family protein